MRLVEWLILKAPPIIITYYFLNVNKRRNEKDNDGGGGVMVKNWLGPVAPTLPIMAKTL